MKHVARKRFGQNFLVDQSVVTDILSALDPEPGDVIVEIGPGLGALTWPLLRVLGDDRLNVVELDRDLAARLRDKSKDHADAGRLIVHEADALAFDFRTLAVPGARLRLVGNLPYNISSPLLFHLREMADRVYDQHFMLQREVVERLVAKAGESAYGRLSVMLQVRYAMESLFDVRPEAFDPAPKVHSALIRMVPLATQAIAIKDEGVFGQVVRQAFSQRRKMLRNTLAEYDMQLPMRDVGLDPSARAETIAPDLYVRYANALFERSQDLANEVLP